MHASCACEYAIVGNVTVLQLRSDCGNRDTLPFIVTQEWGVQHSAIKSSTNRT